MKQKISKKILSVILTFNLVLQSFSPFLVSPVYADDSTPSATPTEEVTPTVDPTPTEEITPTPEITPEVTPTVEPTPTPTVEITPTPDITPEITPIPTDAIVPDETPTPTVEITPTFEVTPTTEPTIADEPSSNTDSHAPPASDTTTNSTDTSSTTIPESVTVATQLSQALLPQPTLTSDKADYFPTDIAYIYGTGFNSGETYTLHIISSDMPMVSFKDEVTADENGMFTYAYQLDGHYRPNYSVDALDASETIVATYTFTDAAKITAKSHDGEMSDGAYAGGNVTTYSEGDYINFRFNVETKDSPTSGQVQVRFTGDDGTCLFFDNYFSLGSIVNVSGTSPTITYSSGPTADSFGTSNGEWIVVLNASSTSNGEATVYYTLKLSDEAGQCNGSSQHSRLNPGGGDVAQQGAQNVPVPANQVIELPEITVTKMIDRDGNGSFESTALASEFSFTLDGTTTLNTNSSGQVTFVNVVPDGSHSITESQVDFSQGTYSFASGTGTNCTFADGTATAVIAAGTTPTNASCTFNNARNTGSLQVLKNVDLNGDGDYTDEGETGSTAWTWDITGGEQDIATGQTKTLTTGDYTISEDGQTDFSLVSWSCSDDSRGITNSIPVTISSTPLTCTFNNARDTGTIVVYKDVQGPAGEDVTDNSNYFEVSLDSGTGQTISDNLTVTYNDIPVGSHTITESLIDSDYTLYGISNTAGGSGNTGGLTLNVTTGTNNVYVTNRQKTGKIIVIKDVVNPNGGEVSDSHPFTANLSPGGQSSSIAEGSNAEFTVNPGTYTVSESEDGDYTNFGCLTATGKTDIVVASGGEVSITCKNQQKPATITVYKNVLKADGVTEVSDSNVFSVTLSGETKDFSEGNPAVFTVNPGGPYAAVESPETNYLWVSQDGSVTVFSNGSGTINIVNKQKAGIISGYKFDATSGLGILNWVINLTGASTLTTYTDASGFYEFLGLNVGSYTVSEDQPSDWTPVGVTSYDLTVTPGDELLQNNFTNFQNGSISGYKYHDLNRNGTKDTDEPELDGWSINLTGSASNSVVTGAGDWPDGYYEFTNLGPGTYHVSEENQNGWVQEEPSDNDHEIVMTSGGNFTGTNFGNFHLEPELSINKVLATTSPSEILVGETATFEITITNEGNVTLQNPIIYDTYDASFLEFVSSSPVAPTTHTGAVADTSDYDEDGDTTELIRDLTWELPVSLAPGESYTLTVVFTAIQATAEPTLTGNEVYMTACYEQCGDGQSLETPTDNAFVDIDSLGGVSGQKWIDTDGDSEWDENESTLNGVTINLLNSDDEVTNTTTTEDNGSYSFTDLATGTYTVCEEVPTGHTQTYPNGCHSITVTDDGDTFEGKNFGNAPLTNIHGYKWSDVDGNGIRGGEGEDLLGGWTIFLDENGNERLDEGEQSDVTDSEGHHLGWYVFNNLIPGVYSICEIIQPGWSQTFPINSEVQSVCHSITLPNDDQQSENGTVGPEYHFGNVRIEPVIQISKTNFAGGDKTPGGSVGYRILINILDADVNNLVVKDLLPKGFVYRTGSYQVVINELDVTGAFSAPTYSSPGTWNLGNVHKGDNIELFYTADISSDEYPGTYFDVAMAQGNSLSGSEVVALAQLEGYIADNFVGTSVKVVKDQTRAEVYDVEKKVEGQVLGASTSLPATGANELWLLASLISLYFGLRLIRASK
ncbi:hypothetical protein A3K29_02660 [Candidatus Collierbacteria bacterium RIFOXYB2_FULL_46_14]|uniref:Cna B domain protein n=1 Tax=Candidatus Collierbacteria bacterium GW2011_GWA2_46_26 TaxID=1618381 RepID=A0A0G1PMD2_9BACT|nr:MAG: Cna B domain protein [Candidatus Collierbacteria bacterium GW2011_GWC2_44_13]KKU33911.1 MAG: Cna B domain protein [Candidatus Collierbacteria bacterium GW2011_GWA2_46_26]OGD73020.1 MAG: hypothetical protein A3K29_02660 [Candidatus Collierbacteria bacterium RIFOXYB2_FULL_46_14]OGD76062.1 MAG: hypothetical protein A3K43_02660 [Candidatus Collierbacteria bacterium RIFOXYA2_FULL_46_20]OGD77398.1 MAG: hypothetical protein A3K39_02660 [Candidatus Collierbacteria bacterium RIFOXYC2_FULL_43_15]